jgi:putative ABC transport system permease protein
MLLEKFPALWRRFGFRTQTALRSLARNPIRTATGIFSSAMATAIIISTLVMYESTWFLVDFQFERVAHSDVDVGMRDEKSAAALLEARDLPGVDYAEALLAVACDMRNGRRARRLAIIGLPPDHRLTTPVGADGSAIRIPPDGLVLSRKLAEVLGVRAGDTLELTPVRGRRETVRVRVASTVESYLGLECYADLSYLSRIVGESAAVNSVQLAVNPPKTDDLFRAIKKLPNAQGLSMRRAAKANIESTFVESMSVSLGLMILFSGVIAFGSTLNSSLIEIADRTRDIATFRVLGFHPRQIAGIFFRQNLIVYAVGVVLAVPLGYGIVLGTAKAYDTELFRMPVIVRWPTVLASAAIAFAFVVVAQWFVYRRIVKLDWLEGIKVKE